MTPNNIEAAQRQLDRCRTKGIAILLRDGELHAYGPKLSAQRRRLLEQYQQEIRVLLGDDGRAHPWTVEQLEGGALMYKHPRLSGEPTTAPQIPPAPIMMPFGKYRGAPVDMIVSDFPYCEWLLAQEWFVVKYPRHHHYLADALERTRDDAEGPSAA